jgi:hypothetical protein
MELTGDLVPIKIEPQDGSIKFVKIDGHLHEKCVYKDKKWIQVCRYKNCVNEHKKNELCSEHYKLLKETYIEGEKVTKGDRQYKLIKDDWKALCSVTFCDNISTSNGYCKLHCKNKPPKYSGTRYIYDMYNVLKQEVMISRIKKTKTLQPAATNPTETQTPSQEPLASQEQIQEPLASTTPDDSVDE